MKKIIYFVQFIFVSIIFVFFKLLGYRISSNFGFIIGKKSYFTIDLFNKSSYGEYFIYVVAKLLSSNIEIIEK